MERKHFSHTSPRICDMSNHITKSIGRQEFAIRLGFHMIPERRDEIASGTGNAIARKDQPFGCR